MADFGERANGVEMMDDFSIVDERLEKGLRDLTKINRWLGGYRSITRNLASAADGKNELTVLDLGTGIADLPAHLVRWADRRGVTCRVTGVDANAATVSQARGYLDEVLDERLRAQVEVRESDATALPYQDDSFDVVTAALFLHHFPSEGIVDMLREMNRLARRGIIVSDLHRHALAYYSIRLLTLGPYASEMVRHDGPLSVRRGFRREELSNLAASAGLTDYSLHWRWAFRWVLSTIS